MANKTNNYKFPKPEADDFYDISEYNKAMDILDDSLTEMDQKKLDKNGDASEAVTEFQQEILRENIESGETLSSMFGKVKKWFAEMKDVAFSGHAKDVTTDAAHRFVSDSEKSSWNGKVGATGGDISETNIDSLESITTEFPVPDQGETTKIFMGKVKKFIQDFNNFKSGIITVGKLVNSGSTTLGGYALDARYGKTLYDLYTQLNNNLGGWKIVGHSPDNGVIDLNSEDCKTPGVHRFFGSCVVSNFPLSIIPDSAMICTGSKFGYRLLIVKDTIYWQNIGWDGRLGTWFKYDNIELTNALTVVDTSYFRLESWADNGVERRGKVIHFHCHFTLLKQTNDWNDYVLVSLPEQFKTSNEFNGEKYVSYNNKSHLFQYFVKPSGIISIKVDNNAPVGTACTLDLTYFAN